METISRLTHTVYAFPIYARAPSFATTLSQAFINVSPQLQRKNLCNKFENRNDCGNWIVLRETMLSKRKQRSSALDSRIPFGLCSVIV